MSNKRCLSTKKGFERNESKGGAVVLVRREHCSLHRIVSSSSKTRGVRWYVPTFEFGMFLRFVLGSLCTSGL